MTTSPLETRTATDVTLDDDALRERLAALTLEQKVRVLTGADFWSLYPEPAAGLRRLVVSDGPAGVRGELWDERSPSANVPSPTALAATWDEERNERLGRLLAGEARRKGVDVLLAPTVNLHRTPYGGRHFECFSEDPLLTARIGAAYVRGLQSEGVGATVKHYVANDTETERFSYDARIDERTLRELYLMPFEVIVRDARVWSVMAAYNSVNGTTATESPLMRDVLKDEWGWDGLVMSDWYAGRSTEAAGNAALDLLMPGPTGPWGDALVEAVRSGQVTESTVDDKVLRLLRLAARVGALDGVPAATPPARQWSDEEIAAELRATAAQSFVLARNDDQTLPLDASTLSRVAVLGPNAAVARTLGGGSATVFPAYTVSPLEGIRAALGDGVEVSHSPGVRAHTRLSVLSPELVHLADGSGEGVEIRFVGPGGEVLGTEQRRTGAYNWLGSFTPEVPIGAVDAVEVHGVLRAEEDGEHLLGFSGVGAFRLTVAGEQVLETRLELPPGADPVEGMMRPPQHAHPVQLSRGDEVPFVVRYAVESPAGASFDVNVASFQVNVEPPHRSDDEEIERAVALARDADVAVVVVGTTEEVESEGYDRDSLALPGRQDELVRRVAEANPRTVVVVNAGAPVVMPWLADVPAVLLVWFPGQEAGNALADVLLGLAEPGGRLPTTWPADENAPLPSYRPVDGVVDYSERLEIGYRRFAREGVEPALWFGSGQGYTAWEYVDVSAPESLVPNEDAPLTVTVRNTGARRGREVVQVYASRPASAVERPVRWLAGYALVEADAGEEATVTVTLAPRAFQHWDTSESGWTVEHGNFRLDIGRSAGDLLLSTEVRVGVGG
ncbi:MAG: glycoside hydrolase family 3 C-terminal domain-containing protein [Actinomycetota bacterium]|nr:glycoside hydrolase family 3 C-terminal domain-containing protein [Actinomycetota bacterium]